MKPDTLHLSGISLCIWTFYAFDKLILSLKTYIQSNLSKRPPANRAFLCDVMLSNNMAASIATAINIHLCKHLFTVLCVMLSPWTSPFVVQVHDDRFCAWCAWLPWGSRSVCAIRRPCWRTAWRQWKRSIADTCLMWLLKILCKKIIIVLMCWWPCE